MNATDLNTALKELMDGLSVKVFRTYNASITLDRLLHKDSVSQTVEEKKADYDLANKEVGAPHRVAEKLMGWLACGLSFTEIIVLGKFRLAAKQGERSPDGGGEVGHLSVEGKEAIYRPAHGEVRYVLVSPHNSWDGGGVGIETPSLGIFSSVCYGKRRNFSTLEEKKASHELANRNVCLCRTEGGVKTGIPPPLGPRESPSLVAAPVPAWVSQTVKNERPSTTSLTRR